LRKGVRRERADAKIQTSGDKAGDADADFEETRRRGDSGAPRRHYVGDIPHHSLFLTFTWRPPSATPSPSQNSNERHAAHPRERQRWGREKKDTAV